MQDSQIPTEDKKTEFKIKKLNLSVVYPSSLMIAVFVVCLLGGVLFTKLSAPRTFPVPSYVIFSPGENAGQLTEDLYKNGYISSRFLFKVFLKISGRGDRIASGEYFFDRPLSVGELSYRFVVGDLNQKRIKVTVPEGSSVVQIAKIIEDKFPQIKQEDFITLAEPSEGHLFPETYFFYQNTTKEEVYQKMLSTYEEKTRPILGPLNLSKSQEKQILILASLLEEEGKTETDKKMIAGILLNRINKGMPLQVDATINYIKGVASRVYFSDLEIESKYNTYQNKGLPPGPISSPGLQSITAALNPTQSSYLYYLTGKDGTFHYARTFEEHVRNKELYLR